MTQSTTDVEPIPPGEIAEAWFSFRNEVWEHLAAHLRAETDKAATQKYLAQRLGMDEGQLSKILKGRKNATLRTLFNLAYAMKRKTEVSFPRFSDLPKRNECFELNNLNWVRTDSALLNVDVTNLWSTGRGKPEISTSTSGVRVVTK